MKKFMVVTALVGVLVSGCAKAVPQESVRVGEVRKPCIVLTEAHPGWESCIPVGEGLR